MTASRAQFSSDLDAPDDLSALRLLKIPDMAPPFDGEIPSSADTRADAADTMSGQDRAASGTRELDRPGPDRLGDWPQQFARVIAEALAGSRPPQQVIPWTTERARIHIRRLSPVFSTGQRPRVLRVLASCPAQDVVEMSVIIALGSRTRALAARLERVTRAGQPPRWLCSDLEAA
jgi:hypothetical protein